MEDSLQFDYVFKYILVGDASVGKTALLSMFVSNIFKGESNPTMGVQFATKKVKCLGKLVKIQVWDTAGQESFRTITRAYYKNAIGIILVYDLSLPDSLKSIESWLSQIADNSNEQAEIILVGNKADLCTKLPTEHRKDYTLLCTSAKTGQNVGAIFSSLTEKILKKIENGEINVDGVYGVKKGNMKSSITLSKEEPNQQQKKSCC